MELPVIPGEPEHFVVEGGALAYNQAGPGESHLAPILLVHGWSCNRHSLALQYRHFARDRRTVAVDLRGHGDSADVEGPYGVEPFALDLLALCDELELEGPVLAGHSMGGAVALEMNRQRPNVASAIVLLDGYGAYPDEERNQVGEMLLGQIDAVGFAPVMAQVTETVFFLTGADPTLVAWVKDQLTVTDAGMAVETYRDLLAWDGAAAARACSLPVLNLVAATPFNQPHRFAEVCAHAVTGQTVGAGHFHVIEVPEQVHAMMDAFLARVENGLPG